MSALEKEGSTPFRAGYVALIGWPNVGKSSLLNALLHAKLSIVTPRPQTTREAILGIMNEEGVQIIFIDTPGWVKAEDSLRGLMRATVSKSLKEDADVVVWVVEHKHPQKADLELAEAIKNSAKKTIVAVNKSDLPSAQDRLNLERQWREFIGPECPIFFVSAHSRFGLTDLKSELIKHLPHPAPFYPLDQLTDRWERFYVAELVREQVFHLFRDEIPYATAVMVEEFREEEGKKNFIALKIFVESLSQKTIIVGRKGQRIRELGRLSRLEIERQLGRPVYLDLKVVVEKNWRKNPAFIKILKDNNY